MQQRHATNNTTHSHPLRTSSPPHSHTHALIHPPTHPHRIHGVHSVTASNLFKYCQPAHGLVLWKHHQPLEFTLEQLGDLLTTAQGWFEVCMSVCRVFEVCVGWFEVCMRVCRVFEVCTNMCRYSQTPFKVNTPTTPTTPTINAHVTHAAPPHHVSGCVCKVSHSTAPPAHLECSA